MYFIPRSFTKIAFAALFVVYIIGLIAPDIMEVDAAQYASISMEMAMTNSFLEVFHLGGNYLDKPPLLFWLGAIFMKIFGYNQVAYRLPSFIATIIGVYATYKLAKHLYNQNTGTIAALVLASCQVYILHNHDVRTDTLLTNFVIIAIWQLVMYLDTQQWRYFFGGFVAIGLAMLSKGPIGIVVPAMALGTHVIYQRQWGAIFKWQWILGILVVLVVLSPMLIGLYTQFDANPLAKVNGRVGVSGLRFYFWEQSFGRITGENVWKDDSSYFFFTHNYLWEFLPWALIGIAAFAGKIIQVVKARFQPSNSIELYTFGGFILPFIALSTSHYKLPHYIMVIMPMAAIFTAAYIDEIITSKDGQARTIFSWIQLVFSLLIGGLMWVILYWIFPAPNAFWWLVPLAIFTLSVLNFNSKIHVVKLMAPSLIAAIGANIIMNGYFYPQLNQYQSGKNVAEWVNEDPDERKENLYLYLHHYHNMNFYSQYLHYDFTVIPLMKKMLEEKPYFYLYTSDEGLEKMKKKGVTYQIEGEFPNFPNAELTGTFLNPETREEALQPRFVVRVER
jgi:4-amino-4-deoxy-L-arabinose transferase-like glycosyltransferase